MMRLALAAVMLVPAVADAAAWDEACNACPPGARWREGAEVRFEVPRDALSGSLAYDLRDAARVWNGGPCRAPSIVAEVGMETRFEQDGVNAVVFVDEAPVAGEGETVIAATCNRCDAEGFIVESDIELFGPAELWNDNCLSPSFSQRGVLLHELGHTLGLSHVEGDGGSVMAGLVSTDRSQRFGSPGEADFDALCERYGALASSSAFTPVEQGCGALYAEAGESCAAGGPVPAGLVCVAEAEEPVWRWVCDATQPCEMGASCMSMEEDGGWGVCLPDAPVRDALVGERCALDADCASGLCFAAEGEAARCLEPCGPSLRCGGACVDVVKSERYRGRWCLLSEAQPSPSRRLLGCQTAAGGGAPMLVLALMLFAGARRRAIRLASRGGAP